MIDYYIHRRMILLRGRLPTREDTLNVGSSQNPYIAPAGCRIINVDSEPATMPHAVRARAEHLPFKNRTFDNILFFDVLEYIADDHAAVNEAWRVLRPSGRLYTTPLTVGASSYKARDNLSHRCE